MISFRESTNIRLLGIRETDLFER